jgi:hypothetical protein
MTIDAEQDRRRSPSADPIRPDPDPDPMGVRLLTVAELQYALRQARRTRPSHASDAASASTSPFAPRAVTPTGRPAGGPGVGDDVGERAIAVVAAHPGAGASTVALALADAMAATGEPVRLVDGNPSARSGFAAVTTAELGIDQSGWRRGRRGERVELYRLADASWPSDVTLLKDIVAGGSSLILDLGWPRTGDTGVGGLRKFGGDARLVVVCRVSVPGVRHAEQVLVALGGNAVVAAVGPTRWPRVVLASCGPQLLQARRADRIVSVPVVPRLAITGLTPDPLPGSVLAAGRVLAARLRQLSAATALPAPHDEEPVDVVG